MTKTITDAVANKIAEISPAVNEKVIDHLVTVELEKRSTAILGGLEKLRGLQNDLKKIKPDVGGAFDEDGTVTVGKVFITYDYANDSIVADF